MPAARNHRVDVVGLHEGVELLRVQLLDLGHRREVHRGLSAEPFEQLVALLGEERLERVLPLLHFRREGLARRGLLDLGDRQPFLGGAGEDAIERIVILRRDGVELVVVAAGAADCEAHHAAADRVEPVVDDVVDVLEEAGTDREEAHVGEVPAVVARHHPVRGELELEEAVEGQVLVEGAHDPVAVGPGVRQAAFVAVGVDVALRVGVAGDVQPVPSPALPVGG